MKIQSRKKQKVDQARLLKTDDAAVWADEFAKQHPEIDQAEMMAGLRTVPMLPLISSAGRLPLVPVLDRKWRENPYVQTHLSSDR